MNKLLYLLAVILMMGACTKDFDKTTETHPYGVFLGLEGMDAVHASEGYETVVIDAQYLSFEEIALMTERGQEVFSYLNVGSLETFRVYFDQYKHINLKPYLDWEEEFWVDVGSAQWQALIMNVLSIDFMEKHIDGFWVDNVDVYSHFPNQSNYESIENILKYLMSFDKPVILNGGDEFVKTYVIHNQNVDAILTGVNQETVFTAIDFDSGGFTLQNYETKTYYLDYLEMIQNLNKKVYLLEYSRDSQVISMIQDFAIENSWEFYVSDSLELE